MNLLGFNAEWSLGPSAGGYRGKNVFGGSGTAEMARGTVLPAKARQRSCRTKYSAYLSHWFPVTVCKPIIASRAVGSLKSRAPWITRFGVPQDCRVITLPFIAEVTTTESCEDTIPDSSVMEVFSHPELTIHWTGRIEDIPEPYNPNWFTFMGQSCSCCAGFTACLDGRCLPKGVSCDLHPV
jgi:hypothetical protein